MVSEQIAVLRQIQHLSLIRDEEVTVGGRAKADELSEKMSKLVLRLDAESSALYSRLVAKNRIFMSP